MERKDLKKAEALAICGDFLGGAWRELALEELGFSEMRGGLSNSLYLCALPEDSEGHPREAVLRVYGGSAQQERRPDLVASEAVTFVLLAERGLGPRLYGLFPGGRLEEYIPSHYLSVEEMRIYSRAIARQMAKIHALEVPAKKTPDLLLNYLTKWLAEARKVLQNGGESFTMSLDEYEKEVEWIKQHLVPGRRPSEPEARPGAHRLRVRRLQLQELRLRESLLRALFRHLCPGIPSLQSGPVQISFQAGTDRILRGLRGAAVRHRGRSRRLEPRLGAARDSALRLHGATHGQPVVGLHGNRDAHTEVRLQEHQQKMPAFSLRLSGPNGMDF